MNVPRYGYFGLYISRDRDMFEKSLVRIRMCRYIDVLVYACQDRDVSLQRCTRIEVFHVLMFNLEETLA